MSILSPSSLSDAEWDRLREVLPSRSPCSRLRRHTLRSIFDAVFSLLRTGCPWASGRYLSCNFPLWQTVYYHFKQFCRTGLWTRLYRALRDAECWRVGKDPDPSAAIIDAQPVKTVEESGCIHRFDAHTWIKGRKRHLLVDTLGLPLSVSTSPSDMHNAQGARRLLAGLKYFVPRLKKISETLIEVALIRLLVARQGRRTSSRVTQFVRNLQTPQHGFRVCLHA